MVLLDKISDLPDDLLCHILSFLPTNFAFNTTLLSKRWFSLFYSLYSLDALRFDYKTFKNSYYLCRFVNNLMLSPLSTNKPLKALQLNCYHCPRKQDSEIINSWLKAANRRGVEELHLNLHIHTLKPNIFISPTLVVLKLEWLEIASDTSCAYLPSLKTLNLYNVSFETRNDYIDFLSACPILQDLDAELIFYMEKNGYNVQEERFKSLTLSKLVRASINSRHAIFNVVKNVEFLSITNIDQEISFKVIPMFQNLIHTKLVFSYSFLLLLCWDTVVELLQHSPKLQNICIRKLTTSSSKEWKYPSSILECVSSHLRSCTILDFDGSANDLRFARYILQNASLLENMKISFNNGMVLEKSQIVKELSSCPRISPTCKLSFGDW